MALMSLRFYRVFLSGHLGGSCRFYPSCSQYAEEAYRQHGVIRASSLTFKRVVACRPFGRHGFDPVPEVFQHE